MPADTFAHDRQVQVYEGEEGGWYWRRIMRRGGRVVCDGAEGYKTKASAKNAAARENPAMEVVVLEAKK